MPVKSHKRIVILEIIILVLNGIFSLALLLSYLAPYVDPRDFWIIALIGILYPFLLLANLVFLIYWSIRLRLYALISGVCILLGFNVLTAYFGFHLSTADLDKPLPGNVRVMAYNVHNFMGLDTIHRTYTQNKIFQLISDNQVDVVSMQEFSVNIKNNQAIYSGLKKAIKSDQYYFKPYSNSPWDSVGVAIFSRFPIINRGLVLSQDEHVDMQAIFADIKCHGKIFRVYSFHLQPIHLGDKEHRYISKIRHRASVSPSELEVICRKLKIAFIRRSAQIEIIRNHLAKCPYPYVLSGDFNDTPISFVVNQIGKGLKNAFINKGGGLGTTYYGDFPHFQIDYIFTSSQFDIINYQTVKNKISDHFAIMSDLKLK